MYSSNNVLSNYTEADVVLNATKKIERNYTAISGFDVVI